MKKNILISTIAILFASGCNKDANINTGNDVNDTDRNFVLKASLANTAEIDAGTLAAFKGTSPDIKSFASMMVSDHNAAKMQLATLASSLGLYAPDSLDAEHVGMKAQLIDLLPGRPFDSVYIHGQVLDHQKTIALFQTEMSAGNNGQLKEFASGQMPHLQNHLQIADSLAAFY